MGGKWTGGDLASRPGSAFGFPHDSVVKNLPANAGDTGSIPGLGRFPGEENGNLLQYSCLGQGEYCPLPSHGQGSLGPGYPPWGCKRVRQDLMNKQPGFALASCEILRSYPFSRHVPWGTGAAGQEGAVQVLLPRRERQTSLAGLPEVIQESPGIVVPRAELEQSV